MNNSSCVCTDCSCPSILNTKAVIAGLSISSVLFLIAVVLIPAFKLHRFLVYRLALYQVISANLCLVVPALTTFKPASKDFYVQQLALGVSMLSLKLLLTLWINFHLFVLSVCHKNLKRLELLYVGSSIIVAVVTYILTLQVAKEVENNIFSNASDKSDQLLKNEFFSLFSVGSFLLLPSYALIVVMVVTLCCRAIKGIGIASLNQKQHKKVLYEMMPLLAYPVLYLLLMVPILSYSIIEFEVNSLSALIIYYKYFSAAIFLLPINASCALIIHVSIVLYNTKRKAKQQYRNGYNTREDVTINRTTTLVCRSETHYSLPTED